MWADIFQIDKFEEDVGGNVRQKLMVRSPDRYFELLVKRTSY